MMSEQKFNKVEAGYHLLQLLAVVDDKFSVSEDLVIRKYLVENFPFHISLDHAMEKISILKKEDYILHFQKCMDDFYEDSTHEERLQFMDFAVKLVSADQLITESENVFLKTLFDAWDIEHAE